MPRLTTVQAAHNYGVLDPQVVERRDTDFVGRSLSDGLNIVVKPQGGYSSRGGTTTRSQVRKPLTAIELSAGMLTAPNGGTAAHLLDTDNRFTTTAADSAAFVVFSCDMGSPHALCFIDAHGLAAGTTGGADAVWAQYWDGSAWQAFGAPLDLTAARNSRRFAAGAPGSSHTTSRFRILVNSSLMAGTVGIDRIAAWTEGADFGDAVVRRYAPEQGQAHQLVITAGNIDVYLAGVWQASALLPAADAILRKIKLEARYDTVLFFAQELEPHRLVRLDASTEWGCDPAPFTNIPNVDYGATYGNVVNEVQEIAFYDFTAGDKFELTLDGLTTEAIEYSATGATTAGNVEAALEALANVEPGLTVTNSGADLVLVTFTGTGNSGVNWGSMGAAALGGSGYVRARTVTQGDPGGEPIISATRGWPAVGRFVQQRLVMAGLPRRPNDILASVLGEPFDLNVRLDPDIAALSHEIDAPDNNAFVDIVSTQTLVLLGSQQLAFLKSEGLSAAEAPKIGQSTAPGIKAGVAALTTNNALLYVQDNGKTLQAAAYSNEEQNFVPENAGVLSAFLIRDPIDMTRRRPAADVDADLVVMVNSDGDVTVLTAMRSTEVSGFAPWRTDGDFVSAVADTDNTLWFIVRRTEGGTPVLRLEEYEPGALLDEAIEISQAASTTITGLSRFNGRQVWAIADGQAMGPLTVTGGQATAPAEVTEVRVGTWVTPFATDPDVVLDPQAGARQARLKRVNRAEISVIATTSLAIAVNGGEAVDVPMFRHDEISLDFAPLDNPFTGKAEAEGMHGFTKHGRLTVTQLFPGALTVRSVTKNVVA